MTTDGPVGGRRRVERPSADPTIVRWDGSGSIWVGRWEARAGVGSISRMVVVVGGVPTLSW
jgi:hypothetical protein